jgi:hypothetical protein
MTLSFLELECLNERLIRRRKLIVSEVSWKNPTKVFAAEELRLTGLQLTAEKMQLHRLFRVPVSDRSIGTQVCHLDSQFFTELAMQTVN